jgi:hypothetical protein
MRVYIVNHFLKKHQNRCTLLQRAAHQADMNWAPLSDVMIAGTPKQAIQSANRALVQSAAVMEERGIASGHLAVLSITVKRYVWLWEEGSSPTKYTCTVCLKWSLAKN